MSVIGSAVPAVRIRVLVGGSRPATGDHVVYWMIASRRLAASFALQRAVELANEHAVPLLVFEPLRVGYPHACDRFHRFVLDGMADNERTAARMDLAYYPYVEPEAGAGRGLLRALGETACAIVTDDAPGFFYPSMLAAASQQVTCRLEAVDSDGLLPLRLADRAFKRAHDFRRHLQRHLPLELARRPEPAPLRLLASTERASVPEPILHRWPRAAAELLRGDPGTLASLPIDHTVGPTPLVGGHAAALAQLQSFAVSGLDGYDGRQHPDDEDTSQLSPWLHFGHLGADEVFEVVARRAGWTLDAVSDRADGRRQGWWGLPSGSEAFVDQLITWRELGRNGAAFLPDHDRYASLPDWARATLAAHEGDARPQLYTLEQLEQARTSDPIWNAAQRQLRSEGRIHTYLRMLWGKRFLDWSPAPQEAARRMLLLNDRYALDGRDPNSIAGISWILGRYDRAWGPERPIFGKVRYMSSANTRKKLRLGAFLERYGGGHVVR